MKLERIAYGGWPNCLRLSNEQIELVATTDVGPRVIRLGFVGGPNLFKEWKEQLGATGGSEWRIYGGHRLWHAPEAQPRTYAPDNSPSQHRWDGHALRLIQPVEPSTGIQKQIELSLDARENRVRVVHRLTNQNAWAVELAPWALSVLQGPGRAILPQEPPQAHEALLLPVRSLALWGYTDMSDPRWVWGRKYIQLRCDPAVNQPQKLGVMNTQGWAAYVGQGALFLKRFGYQAQAAYPDFGANTEAYTNGDMLEVETLGPLTRLEPGTAVEHVEQWLVRAAEVDETETAIDRALLPLVQAGDR